MDRKLTKSKFSIRVFSRVAAGYPTGTQFGNQRFHFAINGINEEEDAFFLNERFIAPINIKTYMIVTKLFLKEDAF
jgi:hypothetical protein